MQREKVWFGQAPSRSKPKKMIEFQKEYLEF